MVEVVGMNGRVYGGKENAPGSMVMYLNMLFNGLSKIFNILYLKFCATTRALIRYSPYVPFRATILPPIFELMSKAFQRW